MSNLVEICLDMTGEREVYATIDTEAHLDATLESQPELDQAFAAWCDANDRDSYSEGDAADWWEGLTGMVTVASDNSYNWENDFSDTFNFTVMAPKSDHDWNYSYEAIIALRVHRGGDVRGNYGAVRFYKQSEGRFLDSTVGWRCEQRPDDFENLEQGYSSNPTYDFHKLIESIVSVSTDSVTVKLKGESEPLTFYPTHYVG